MCFSSSLQRYKIFGVFASFLPDFFVTYMLNISINVTMSHRNPLTIKQYDIVTLKSQKNIGREVLPPPISP